MVEEREGEETENVQDGKEQNLAAALRAHNLMLNHLGVNLGFFHHCQDILASLLSKCLFSHPYHRYNLKYFIGPFGDYLDLISVLKSLFDLL